jgi:hypothetical protein
MVRRRVRSRLSAAWMMVCGSGSTRRQTIFTRRAGHSALLAVLLMLIDRRFIPGVYAARAAIWLERFWESTILDQPMNVLPAIRNAFDRFQSSKNEKSHWVASTVRNVASRSMA